MKQLSAFMKVTYSQNADLFRNESSIFIITERVAQSCDRFIQKHTFIQQVNKWVPFMSDSFIINQLIPSETFICSSELSGSLKGISNLL